MMFLGVQLFEAIQQLHLIHLTSSSSLGLCHVPRAPTTIGITLVSTFHNLFRHCSSMCTDSCMLISPLLLCFLGMYTLYRLSMSALGCKLLYIVIIGDMSYIALVFVLWRPALSSSSSSSSSSASVTAVR